MWVTSQHALLPTSQWLVSLNHRNRKSGEGNNSWIYCVNCGSCCFFLLRTAESLLGTILQHMDYYRNTVNLYHIWLALPLWFQVLDLVSLLWSPEVSLPNLSDDLTRSLKCLNKRNGDLEGACTKTLWVYSCMQCKTPAIQHLDL